jgi:DNA-directed RNA polymerase subunit RPC12/RpoP
MVDTSKDLENDVCICGRFAWRVHCPHCGAYHNYSYARRDVVTRQDQTVEHLTVYKCRRCAATFNDDDWKIRCKAPNIALMTKAGRKPGETSQPMKFASLDDAPEVMRKLVEDVQRKRGIK